MNLKFQTAFATNGEGRFFVGSQEIGEWAKELNRRQMLILKTVNYRINIECMIFSRRGNKIAIRIAKIASRFAAFVGLVHNSAL